MTQEGVEGLEPLYTSPVNQIKDITKENFLKMPPNPQHPPRRFDWRVWRVCIKRQNTRVMYYIQRPKASGKLSGSGAQRPPPACETPAGST